MLAQTKNIQSMGHFGYLRWRYEVHHKATFCWRVIPFHRPKKGRLLYIWLQNLQSLRKTGIQAGNPKTQDVQFSAGEISPLPLFFYQNMPSIYPLGLE